MFRSHGCSQFAAQVTVSRKGDGVRLFVSRRESPAVTTLEFHQLPRCAEEIGPRLGSVGLRMRTGKED
jgi:hypothetical protein